MNHFKKSIVLLSITNAIFPLVTWGQTLPRASISPSKEPNSKSINLASVNSDTLSSDMSDPLLSDPIGTSTTPPLITPHSSTSFAVAQIIPAYKIALKKGMFEVMTGIGHIDGSKETNRGQPSYIKTSPQTDFTPIQIAYGLGDNTNISLSGKLMRTQDKVTESNLEGTTEPQISLSHTFRNSISAINLIGTYSADVGAQNVDSIGVTRTEGNTLAGGASTEVLAGYYARLDPVILGAEMSYLYKDTRVINRNTSVIFTGQSISTQYKVEGGNEKTIRGVLELALPLRVGITFGRTWLEQEEEIPVYQLTHILHNSYYKDFISAYGRIQINPRLSLLPFLSYSNSPDTSEATSKNDQNITTQFNLRFRF